jgi:hypothetical protein
MAHLITFAELARWTQNEVAEVTVDPFAEEVCDKVSGLARFLGGNEDWELDPAEPENKVPYDVRLVVLAVAKRCYENPAQVVQEGSLGPIGGDRVLDVAALLFELRDTERATLTKYNLEGDPDGDNGIFVIRTTPRPETTSDAVLFVPDDSLSDCYIPLFSPLDPGDPELYPEEG